MVGRGTGQLVERLRWETLKLPMLLRFSMRLLDGVLLRIIYVDPKPMPL